MLKSWLGAGVGGACGIIVAWWMRKAWGWEVGEDVQTAFASIFTAVFATLDAIFCTVGVWIATKLNLPTPTKDPTP